MPNRDFEANRKRKPPQWLRKLLDALTGVDARDKPRSGQPRASKPPWICFVFPNSSVVDRLHFHAYNGPVMPELPEVETVARELRASLVGCAITSVEIRWIRSVVPPDPVAFSRRIGGQTIVDVGRRGKWLVFILSEGDTLLVHLRMTGRFAIKSVREVEDPHERVLFVLDDGRWLSFSDQRKFGRMVLTSDPQEVLGELGPEPLDRGFTVARLGEMLARRRGRIKPLLLNQRFLAGLGNIYADEALWRARIHPLRRANTLTSVEVRRLHSAIRSVLRGAIANGGTSLADTAYRQPDGRLGAFGELLAVYGREGRPCSRCGTIIERIRVSQRGTHICPHCQCPPVS